MNRYRVLQTAGGHVGSGLKNPASRAQGCNSVCDTEVKPIPEILTACPLMQTKDTTTTLINRTVLNGTTSRSWPPMLIQPRKDSNGLFRGDWLIQAAPEKPASASIEI
jgi:hypothetical protein